MFARVLMYFSIPVVLVLAWYAWDQARTEVEVVAVETGHAVDAVPAQITLERVVEINVNAEIAGRVMSSTIKTGQSVKAGAVLFELAPIGKPNDRVPVLAAFDGVITKILVRPGEAVPAFTPLAHLWNGLPEVVANVAPEHFAHLAAGLDAEVTLPNETEGWIPARVMKVPSFANGADGAFRVILALDLPAEQLLPGLKGRAIIIRRRIPNALLIPTEALNHDGTVFVANGKHAQRITIQTGLSYHGKVQVLAGLTTADIVISRSASPLETGTRIRVRGY